MKKVLLAVLVLALVVIPCTCFANAVASYHISNIYVTFDKPERGVKVPISAEASAPNSTLEVSYVSWYNKDHVKLGRMEVFEAGDYTAEFEITRKGGDALAKTTGVFVNSSKENVTVDYSNISSNVLKVTYAITISGQIANGRLSNVGGAAPKSPVTMQNISFTMPTPSYNGSYITTSQVQCDASSTLTIDNAGWSNETDGVLMTNSDKFEAKTYEVRIYFTMHTNYVIDDNTNVTLNGKKVTLNKVSSKDAQYYFDYQYEVSLPSRDTAGSRPTRVTATPEPTTVNVRPSLTDGIPISRPTVELSSGEFVRPTGNTSVGRRPVGSGDTIVTRPSTTTNASGETKVDSTTPAPTSTTPEPKTTTPEPKTTTQEPKTTTQEPTITEKPAEKIVWASASPWALDELNKANEAGMIPTLFNKEDLTKNITRKEFAYVAVRLYEKISGKKAEAESKNPFKDTKDTEVLKAYKVGITNGVSDTEFDPDSEITREQMATMMTRALQKAGIDTMVNLNKVDKFDDDNEMSSWSRDSIYFMSNKGIIKGMGDNKFGVKGTATREQSLLISLRSVETFKK